MKLVFDRRECAGVPADKAPPILLQRYCMHARSVLDCLDFTHAPDKVAGGLTRFVGLRTTLTSILPCNN